MLCEHHLTATHQPPPALDADPLGGSVPKIREQGLVCERWLGEHVCAATLPPSCTVSVDVDRVHITAALRCLCETTAGWLVRQHGLLPYQVRLCGIPRMRAVVMLLVALKTKKGDWRSVQRRQFRPNSVSRGGPQLTTAPRRPLLGAADSSRGQCTQEKVHTPWKLSASFQFVRARVDLP